METAVTPQSLPLIIWLLGFTYFLPALILAGIMLGVPALRRRKPTRWIGLVAAGIAALFPLSGLVTLVQFGAIMGRDSLGQANRTHHLKTPQTLAGILFPAGSTIVLDKDHPDFIETGTLAAPTLIHGLLLTGTFSMPAPSGGNSPNALSGTLAQPATIAGIPCAAAPINLNATFTSCILARAVVLHGFSLAAGTYVQTRLQPTGDFLLEQASLALPTPIFDVIYPAGTILTPEDMSASRLAHVPYPESGIMVVCLPPTAEVTLGEAVLHGPTTLGFSGEEATMGEACPYRAGDQEAPAPVTNPGFGLVHQQRFLQGTYNVKTNTWTNLNNSETTTP